MKMMHRPRALFVAALLLSQWFSNYGPATTRDNEKSFKLDIWVLVNSSHVCHCLMIAWHWIRPSLDMNCPLILKHSLTVVLLQFSCNVCTDLSLDLAYNELGLIRKPDLSWCGTVSSLRITVIHTYLYLTEEAPVENCFTLHCLEVYLIKWPHYLLWLIGTVPIVLKYHSYKIQM